MKDVQSVHADAFVSSSRPDIYDVSYDPSSRASQRGIVPVLIVDRTIPHGTQQACMWDPGIPGSQQGSYDVLIERSGVSVSGETSKLTAWLTGCMIVNQTKPKDKDAIN